MWGKLLARSFPHTPFKNSLQGIYKNRALVSKQTVGACTLARFCSRERVGTTKTPRAKKYVKEQKYIRNVISATERSNIFLTKKVPPHPFKKALYMNRPIREYKFQAEGATIGRPRQSQTTFLTGRVLEVPDR